MPSLTMLKINFKRKSGPLKRFTSKLITSACLRFLFDSVFRNGMSWSLCEKITRCWRLGGFGGIHTSVLGETSDLLGVHTSVFKITWSITFWICALVSFEISLALHETTYFVIVSNRKVQIILIIYLYLEFLVI